MNTDRILPSDRSWDRLRAHYEIERQLALRLKNSTKAERGILYASLYNELFSRVPDHPQLVKKQASDNRRSDVDDQIQLLKRFLGREKVMIEIGPGDCALSFRACDSVKKVYGVDVSGEITRRADVPANFELTLSDGVSVPAPSGGVDVVYSNQLMEHLHPEDAADQLRNIMHALTPGGVYLCITPNVFMGPHDISQFFSESAEGFHLKEYSATELIDMFRKAGFTGVSIYVKVKGRHFVAPEIVVRWIERALDRKRGNDRRALTRRFPFRLLSTICIAGARPRSP